VEDGARRLLALLGLAIFFEGYGRSLPSTTLAEIGSDLGVTSSALSFALALVATGALGVILLGSLADRIGRRRVLLVCIAGYGLLGTLTGLAHTLPAFVGWQAAARMFQEGALTTAAVVATEEMPAARRGAAQGVLGLVNQLGAGIAGLALAIVRLVPGGWRGLMILNLAPLAALPFLRRALPESHRWSAEKRAARAPLPRRYHARLAAAAAVAFLAMSYDVAGFAFSAYVPITEHGWSPAETSAMIIFAGGLGLPGWWVGGEVADRLGRRPGAVVFLLGLTVAEAVFFQLGTSALWPGFFAMVFCQSGKTAVLRTWTTELFPTAWRASASSWLSAAATLGGISGLALAGALAPHVGGIGPALTLVAGAGVLAAGCSILLPETRALELEAIAPDP
jgi:putative MFS transporter